MKFVAAMLVVVLVLILGAVFLYLGGWPGAAAFLTSTLRSSIQHVRNRDVREGP